MDEQPNLPEHVVSQLTKNTSCFILAYYDMNGNPCFYQNYPQMKDRNAIMKLLMDYVNSDGMPFETDGEIPPDGEGDEGESWK